MKKLIFALTAVAALNAGSVSAKQWENVRIGVEGAYPPYSWITPEGKLAGFDIDIANALCEEMQVKCTLVAQDWDGMIPTLISTSMVVNHPLRLFSNGCKSN